MGHADSTSLRLPCPEWAGCDRSGLLGDIAEIAVVPKCSYAMAPGVVQNVARVWPE